MSVSSDNLCRWRPIEARRLSLRFTRIEFLHCRASCRDTSSGKQPLPIDELVVFAPGFNGRPRKICSTPIDNARHARRSIFLPPPTFLSVPLGLLGVAPAAGQRAPRLFRGIWRQHGCAAKSPPGGGGGGANTIYTPVRCSGALHILVTARSNGRRRNRRQRHHEVHPTLCACRIQFRNNKRAEH